MKNYEFATTGVCAKQINFGIDDDGKLRDVKFFGGCPGNTIAVGKLIEGKDAKEIADILRGNPCGNRGTSCADQLAIAIDQALASA